jgi:large subunit ribosomal protein L35Ae
MKGTIANFRRGRHTVYHTHMIIHPEGIDSREKASGLVGKKVVWQAPGKQKKQLTGKVASAHGGKGAVRVIFETGMPGQSLGKEVEIN